MNKIKNFLTRVTLTGTFFRLTRTQKAMAKEALLVLIVTLIVAFLFGCGVHKSSNYNNAKDDEQDARLSDIEYRIKSMTDAYRHLEEQFWHYADSNDIVLEEVQQAANLALAQLAGLQENVQVYKIIDPCGDGVGFDEIVLKTSQGYIAYFESGTTRHLSLLPQGSYRTTDQQQCTFQITSEGMLHNGVLE